MNIIRSGGRTKYLDNKLLKQGEVIDFYVLDCDFNYVSQKERLKKKEEQRKSIRLYCLMIPFGEEFSIYPRESDLLKFNCPKEEWMNYKICKGIVGKGGWINILG